jgi:hypothetical protein
MADQTVQKFLDMLKQDKALQAQVQKEMLSAGSADAALDKAAAIAQGKGFKLTGADLKVQLPSVAVPTAKGELNQEQLEAVAGGRFWNWAKETIGSSTFACYICAMGTSG